MLPRISTNSTHINMHIHIVLETIMEIYKKIIIIKKYVIWNYETYVLCSVIIIIFFPIKWLFLMVQLENVLRNIQTFLTFRFTLKTLGNCDYRIEEESIQKHLVCLNCLIGCKICKNVLEVLWSTGGAYVSAWCMFTHKFNGWSHSVRICTHLHMQEKALIWCVLRVLKPFLLTNYLFSSPTYDD